MVQLVIIRKEQMNMPERCFSFIVSDADEELSFIRTLIRDGYVRTWYEVTFQYWEKDSMRLILERGY